MTVVYVGDSVRSISAVAEFGDPIVGTPSEIAALGNSDQRSRKEAFAVPITKYEVIDGISLEHSALLADARRR